MVKFAIVIPSYNDAAGLWYTVAACRADLEADFSPDDYEIIAVVDGPEDDETRVILGMKQNAMCRVLNVNTRTPQKNRHIGLLQTDAPYVFFLDSHIVPSRGYFKRMYDSMLETGAAMIHAGHCFWRRDKCGTAYAYHMNWKDQFWSETAECVPQAKDRPYPICLAGHGAVCVDRAQYLEVGGYWDALEGWGGEEPQLNLKFWLLGKTVMMEPRVYHWHFMPMKRNLCGIQVSDRYAKNFMLVAYASGGQKYLDAVHYFFNQLQNGHKSIDEALAAEAILPYSAIYDAIPKEAEAEREAVCAGPFGGDLDRLREYFVAEGIPH